MLIRATTGQVGHNDLCLLWKNSVKIKFYWDLRRHLQKAFDTLDHWILLNKLNHYSFQTTPLKWFHRYFKDHSQHVDYDGTILKICPITTDVPQGSILGLLLFIIYMNILTRPAVNIAMNKSISNELDITCHVFASQLSGHCDVIANRLWRHQQNVKRVSETWGWCVKILIFSVIYGFVMSCKKYNNVCTLVTNCLCAHSNVILVFISLVAAQLGKYTP